MAVKKYPIRELGGGDGRLPALLRWREAFIASGMSAHGTVPESKHKGRLSDEMFSQYCTSMYAVYSYDTAIAWEVMGTWYVNEDKYSSTTGWHQNMVKAALTAADIEYILL